MAFLRVPGLCSAVAALMLPVIMLPLTMMTAAPAAAQQVNSRLPGLALSNDQPIQIESDRLDISEADGRAVFKGNVKVVQGDTTLQSGIMTVFYRKGGGSVASGASDIDKIEVAQKVLLRSGTQTATADTGTFDMGTEVAVLKGEKVVLTEGDNIFIGCSLTVNMRTGEAQLDSCGGRVMIQLDPKSRPKQ